jgi:KDO2-lipid IV(A) lauroyltransferase
LARPFQKIKNDIIYVFVRILLAFLLFLPGGLRSLLGRTFGGLLFLTAGGERQKTLRNIRMAFSTDFSDQQVRQLAWAVWTRLGQTVFETVSWLNWPSEKIVAQVSQVRGWENLERAFLKKKGVFIVTAHLGNWELLGGYLASRHSMSAVAQKLYDSRFDKTITVFREKNLRVSMIKRGMALRGILEALRKNRLVMVLCDQDTGKDGVFTPFFGKAAWTQSGTARVALKTGTPLVPAFMVRGTDGRFVLHIEPEISFDPTGDLEKDVLEITRRYTEVIESYVRAYPEQWVWMHERWRTRPPEEASSSKSLHSL